jgi:hypothetical protein
MNYCIDVSSPGGDVPDEPFIALIHVVEIEPNRRD